MGLTPTDPFSQPMHRRSMSGISSPSATSVALSMRYAVPTPSHGVPIPRPSSSIHRPVNQSSETTTPLSRSPSSAESRSPFPLSPVMSAHVPGSGSLVSNGTHVTTPSSSSVHSGVVPGTYGVHALTYPSVPPPSLSSSYGSPVVSYFPRGESPAEGLSRRGSGVHGPGAGWRHARSGSRRDSVERGGRIAETGTLVPRSSSRAESAQVTENGNEAR